MSASMPASSTIACVNSYHEQRAGAREMHQAGGPLLDRFEQCLGQIRGVGRTEPLVGDHLELPLLAGTADRAGYEVATLRGAAVQAVQPRRARDQRVGCVRERRVLAGDLRQRVDAARGRRRVLRVGLAGSPVEHVVRAHMHQLRVRLSAALRQAFHGARVHRERAILLTLADLDVVEGGAVEHDLRPHFVEVAPDGIVVGVERLATRRRRARPAAPRGPTRAARRRR